MQIKKKINRFKKLYIYFFSYVLFIIFFSTTFLQANSFKVSDIEISEPFELNFNKNKVIDDGFKSAFINLVSMITTSGDKVKIQKTSLKVIKSMIDTFTIADEKFVNDEYFAKLEVTFNKKNILNFLEKKNIFPSIPLKNKVLIIPIFINLETDNIYLFTNNIFYEKWNNNYKNYYLLDYLLPSEDIEDLNIIQTNYQRIEDYEFLELIKKYDLQDYIITIIFKNKNELRVLSKVNLNDSLKIDNQIFYEIDLNNEDNFLFVLDELKNIYENYWKKNNEINTSIKLPLTIKVNSKQYNKIDEFENILNSLDLIYDFHILNFNNNETFFKIFYNGSPKTFLKDMKLRNFELIKENNLWVVK